MNYELASSTWGEEELQAINDVIKKDRYSMGEAVSEFEQVFASTFGSRFAVMVNSGSSANLLAIAALVYKEESPLKPGDEIIVPSVSWSTTYFPVHQYGLKLVFVDVDINSLNLDSAHLEEALSPRTRGIFVPHLLGNPADIASIQAFCDDHGLYLIEDNCESMGAEFRGKRAGTFGICGTFSTFFSHHISTMEGGMVVTDDEEIYHILLSLRSHGWTRHLPMENKVCTKSEDPFLESFRFVLPGYNLRPVEMSGAIGLEQIKKLDGFVAQRRSNAAYFHKRFSGDGRFLLQRENGESSWFGFSMIINSPDELPRERVVKALQEASIDVRPIVAGNFLVNDVIRHLNHRVVGTHQNAQNIHDNGFFVGNHQFDIKEKIDYLFSIMDSI